MPTLNKIWTAFAGPSRRQTRRQARRQFRPPTDPAGLSLRRLRAALTVFFALDGFVFAGWVVRIPAIKQQVGASASALGLALLGVSAGAVATMLVTGRLCRIFGSREVTIGTAVLLSLSVALPPLTPSALTLGLVLIIVGIAYGGMNVAMNSVAVDLVAALRRPVMPSFHAAYSLGGLVGAGLGGVLAAHLTPTRHLLLLVPLGLAGTFFAGRVLMAYELPRTAGPGAGAGAGTGAVRTRAPLGRSAGLLVGVFGLIGLCTAYGEGALAEWGPLHIELDLGGGPGTAAAGYAAVALAMTVGRLSGTALLERLGQTRMLVAGGLTACGGMLLAAFAPYVWLVLVGFGVTGLGLANIFPVAIARAGALGGSDGVATASTLGYAGFLLGPPTIGFLADAAGLPTALTTVAVLAALSAVIAFTVRNASVGADN
ncbi:MFS transporter [Streptomyces sp. NBC_01537]|uniref:MFS transporter n=1 Tax=Streptomyces sp. NBC_01537 TaxID=2903896 RepID=UPI0038663C0E